jgi:hypothetical protein
MGEVVEVGGEHGLVRQGFLRMRHLFGAGNTLALAGVFFVEGSQPHVFSVSFTVWPVAGMARTMMIASSRGRKSVQVLPENGDVYFRTPGISTPPW